MQARLERKRWEAPRAGTYWAQSVSVYLWGLLSVSLVHFSLQPPYLKLGVALGPVALARIGHIYPLRRARIGHIYPLERLGVSVGREGEAEDKEPGDR